jgi:hypothetical protein
VVAADSLRFYDLSTVRLAKEKPGLSHCEKKLLESIFLTLQNLHSLAHAFISKTLVYDLNSAFFGRLFVGDINLVELVKSCVLNALSDMKRCLKGDRGSNSNLIVLLANFAHIVTLSLVDDAILNGGSARVFSKSFALQIESQLQDARSLFEKWLESNLTDFSPALYPSLLHCRHFEFLLTEIVPMMQRDSEELVSLFQASYAKAENHVPVSSPYFLSRIILARDDGDAAAAAFR